MSIYTPAPIETCETWNEVLGRGVPASGMPSPGMPLFQRENISGAVDIVAEASEAGSPPTYFSTMRHMWTDGGWKQWDATPPHSCLLGGVWVQPVNHVITEGTPQTGGFSSSHSNAINILSERNAGVAEMIAHGVDWDTMTKFTPYHLIGNTVADRYVLGDFYTIYENITYGRFRFKIPSWHTGSYFKISWDLRFTPLAGDPEIIAGDEVIWTGPGDPDNYSDPSWFTDWQYVDPPATNGGLEPVNLKFWNLSTSPYGLRPNTAWPA